VSIKLLHRLAREKLPIHVTAGEDVDQLRVLHLAGHVKARIPLPVRTLSGYDQPPALVEAITRIGRAMLDRFPDG